MVALILFLSVFIFPQISGAAYQNPTVVSNERQVNGAVVITFVFTGNAGEPSLRRGYVVNAASTMAGLRNWVDDTIKELDLIHTAATIPGLQVGQTINRLAKVVPTPTAKQIWAEKFGRYLRAKDAGLTNATLTSNLNALKADLEATYQSGFLDAVE